MAVLRHGVNMALRSRSYYKGLHDAYAARSFGCEHGLSHSEYGDGYDTGRRERIERLAELGKDDFDCYECFDDGYVEVPASTGYSDEFCTCQAGQDAQLRVEMEMDDADYARRD